MSGVIIRPASRQEISAFYPKSPITPLDAEVAIVDGEPIAMGGVVREPLAAGTLLEDDAPLIAFLDVRKQTGPLGVKAVLAMRRGLKRHGVKVLVQCDADHPTAERLLRLLGFKPTDKLRADARERGHKLRIWQWQC